MTTDTCGLTSCEPFAKWDHDSQCWRTSEATSLWALTLSSLTLPQWGGLHDGELCEHPTPELATSALDCSSLPTPAAMLGASDVDFQVSGDGRSKPNKLGWAIGEMLPTPTVNDASNITRASGCYKSLTRTATTLLPTPAVNDMGEGKSLEWWDDWAPRQKSSDGRPAPHGRSLAIEAQRLLPTPTTQHASGGYNPDWGHGMTLLDAAKEIHLLGTPTATMRHRSERGISKNPNPAEVASQAALTGVITQRPSPDGSASQDDQPHHQLSLLGLAHPA